MSPAETLSTREQPGDPPTLAEQLERGEILFFPRCPFPLPQGEALAFLLAQELAQLTHKNISYNPFTGKVAGYVRRDLPGQEERLRDILEAFSREATRWVEGLLPRYIPGLQSDMASYRPLEEATRRLRLTARNDLLHIDAFPNRPSRGRRILRLWVNVNPHESRIWATADTFPRLLERYGREAGLPAGESAGWLQQLGQTMLRAFKVSPPERTGYDEFMLRLHDFLKGCDSYQDRAVKRIWTFPSGSAWLGMTDAVAHAVLRGRFALEHSFFVSQEVLALPEESPAAILARACGLVNVHGKVA